MRDRYDFLIDYKERAEFEVKDGVNGHIHVRTWDDAHNAITRDEIANELGMLEQLKALDINKYNEYISKYGTELERYNRRSIV